jgi:Caudoviral major tail protein N-terminus
MTVAPNTQVCLLQNIPFSNTYKHQRTFNSVDDQTNYFLSKVGHIFIDFTYQREEKSIKVPIEFDELYHTNYLMYQNSQYSNKWFYAFITKKEYVNPMTTRVYFEVDVFQTWQFNMQWKPCQVIREHRTRWNIDGSPVVNTVDEGLDYGSEYETVSVEHVQAYETIYFLVIVSKGLLHGSEAKNVKPSLNGVPQPLSYYIHPFKMNGSSPKIKHGATIKAISDIEQLLLAVTHHDATVNNIVNMYITEYIGYKAEYDAGEDSLYFNAYSWEHIEIADDKHENVKTLYLKSTINYNTMVKTLGNKYKGFNTVTESKLLMYPYTVTVLTDLKGKVIPIKNEYINDPDLAITIKGSMGTDNKVSYQVQNYLKQAGVDYGSEIALETALINNSPNDLPIITDLLSAYLQGNRNQLANQTNSLIFQGVLGAIGSGSPAGAVISGANTAFQLQALDAKKQDIDATPPSISGMGGNTAFDYGNNVHGLYILKKQITKEYRDKLTDYFKMFGYRLGRLKTPSLKTRQHFNYLQTADCLLTGSIPHDDLIKLQSLFNQGITLWHGDWVGDYSKANNEV